MRNKRSKMTHGAGSKALMLAIALLSLVAAMVGGSGLLAPAQPPLIPAGSAGTETEKLLNQMAPAEVTRLLTEKSEGLVAEPLQLQQIFDISILQSLQHNDKKAEELILLASERTQRNVAIQVAAARIQFQRQNFGEGLKHVDAALTVNEENRPQLFAMTYGALTAAGAPTVLFQELSAILNRPPDWREGFFAWLAANDTEGQITALVYYHLRKADGKVNVSELRPFLQRQVELKAFQRAYFIWLDSLDSTQLLKVGQLYDGGFDLTPDSLQFDWTITPFINSEIRVVRDSGKTANRVLELQFFQTERYFEHVKQYTRMSPGAYVFRGSQMAEQFKSPGGLAWNVKCAETGTLIGQGKGLTESTPWTNFAFNFDVPAAGCETQILTLQSASHAILDAKMNGNVYYDNLEIQARVP